MYEYVGVVTKSISEAVYRDGDKGTTVNEHAQKCFNSSTYSTILGFI